MSSQESDVEEKLINLDINDDKTSLEVFNILLLGETGVGKSTFINSVANYLTYKYFDVAEKNNLQVLIPSEFTVRDKHNADHKIKIGSFSDINEYLETGESATQDVKTYVFPIWKGKVKVRLIDTPGLGDTRGIEQDEKNCHNVLKFVSRLDHLHAICFLFKPSEARKTMFFEYCFSQLLCHLDKLACSKLFFLFTKTRGANYGATDTINILETIFTEIKKYSPDVDIPLSLDSNVFCFDNEGFRYIAAQQQKIKFSDEEKINYKKSWKTSAKSWWNLLKSVRRCNQMLYTPRDVAALTNARKAIRCFSKALSKIADTMRDNNDILQKLFVNRENDAMELDILKTKQTYKAKKVHREYNSKPSMVCTASSCIETYKVGDETQKHYKTICHSDCEEVDNAEKDYIGHPELVNCYVINKLSRECIHCKCDFSVHLWIDYQTSILEANVLDDDILKQINIKESVLRSSLDVIHELQRKNYDLKQEYDTIKEVCHKMASFIRQIAIIPFNYCYREYVEQCIWAEQSNQFPNKMLLETYRTLIKENEELNKIFEDAFTTNEAVSLLDSDVSLEEIESRYEQLYNLKFSGGHIRELLGKDQVLIANDDNNEIAEYVHDIKFDYKKDRKNKEKHKEKTNKEDKRKDVSSNINDKNSMASESYDSDVSSIADKKERKNKRNRGNKSKKSDTVGESSDGNVRKEDNKTNNQKKDGQKKWINKKNSRKTQGGQCGANISTDDMHNIQRTRTPPPPYSQIVTPSGSKINVDNNSSGYFAPNGPMIQKGENVINSGNPSNDNKYEITVSIKEKQRNPSPGNFSNTQQSPNNSQRPPFPPSFPSQHHYGPYAPYDPRYAVHGPRYPSQGPPYAPQGPPYAPQGPPYVPQGAGYTPQRPSNPAYDPRYAPHPQHGQRYPLPNPQYQPHGPRHPQGNRPFVPPSNTNSHFGRPQPPPYSPHPPTSNKGTERKNDGRSHHSKNGKDENKQGKSNTGGSGDKNTGSKKGKDENKQGKSKTGGSGDKNTDSKKGKDENKQGKSKTGGSGDKNTDSKNIHKGGHQDGKNKS